ncbi:MAG: sigma-70 family RNA polymerase sigma factor [Planctomycetes bacterium]|nr:sigma-70 family RNA polymerase sigma factor [Planctomycetota bacterium]
MAASPDPAKCLEFERLFRPLLDSLHRTAARLTRDAVRAEDLVQETALKAFRSFEQYEAGSNFKAWVFRILTNEYINLYRQRARRPAVVDFAEVEPVYEEATEDPQFFTREESDVLREQLTDEVTQALDRLPAEFREALLLSVFEGFSYRELSTTLGVPMGTVMSRLYRARQALQKDLRHTAEEAGILRRTATT